MNIKKWTFTCQADREEYEEYSSFVGTEEKFKEMRKEYQDLWGYGFWNIKEVEPTKKDIDWYLSWKEEEVII